MVLSKRERTIVLAAVGAVALLVLDQLVLSPVLTQLDQLSTDKTTYTGKLDDAAMLFRNQKAKEARWNQMIADGLKSDAADAEDTLDHAVYEWAQASGLSLKSCTPERTMQRDRSEVVLYVVGTGNMGAVAHFLYRAQTSKLPVQPEDVEIGSRREATDDLNVTLHLSALYFPAGPRSAPSGGTAPAAGGTRQMISRKLMLGAAVLCLAAVSPAALAAGISAPAPAAPKTPAPVSFDKYEVLLQNNPFVRVHPRIFREHDRARSPLNAEEATALRGVVRQGEGPNATYYVFLEDVRTQETTKMRVGDPVCAGKLVNPKLDSVEYLKNGVAKRIAVGQNLTGAEAVAPVLTAQPSQSNGPEGFPGGSEGAGNSSNLQPVVRSAGGSSASSSPPLSPEKIAEQMRLKRLKELGK